MKVALPQSPYNRVDLFEAAGLEVVEAPVRSKEDFIDLLRDADGAQVGVMPLTSREVLEACPKLKVVSRLGVGVDSIDLDAATELGVLACNVPGVNTTEVADHAVAMLLALTRRIPDAVNTIRAGGWRETPRKAGEFQRSVRRHRRPHGRHRRLRQHRPRLRHPHPRLRPVDVVAYDPYVPQTAGDLYGVRMVSFEELLESADYITIHCSATSETRHMFDSNALGKLKPTALLVNTARGPIIDGKALAAALEAGQLEAGGAGRDGDRADRIGRSAPEAAELHRHAAHRRLLAGVPRRVSDPSARRTSFACSAARRRTASRTRKSSRPSPLCVPPIRDAGRGCRSSRPRSRFERRRDRNQPRGKGKWAR